MTKVLITGATGFIGKQLILDLLEKGYEVFALSRTRGISLPFVHKNLHLLFGDFLNPSGMDKWPSDIEAAFYLIHSMGDVSTNLERFEEKIALNFLEKIENTKCKQIIYLSGIMEETSQLSTHLQSRLSVEKALKQSKIPLTILRASMIIGPGSASFEIVRDLCEKLPIMIAPKWVKNLCQPISIQDVLFYLSHIVLKKKFYNRSFDIGGPDVVSFKDLLLKLARFRNLKRWIIVVPVLTPRLSSYWLFFISSVKFSLCFFLVESMKSSTIKINNSIDDFLLHSCLTLEQSFHLTFEKIVQNNVISSWADAWSIKHENLKDLVTAPQEGCFIDKRQEKLKITTEEAKKKIWSLGGKNGWYSMNWAWSLRGFVDKVFGGMGKNRGRRHPYELSVGDNIDFWRVLYLNEPNGHLILYAEMKLPGEAWLEFKVDFERKELIQIATFRPKGLCGRFYWYICMPFHLIIFKNMAKVIAGQRK